jgi:hypothetical protein
MKGYERNVGLIGENWVEDGDHESQGCNRKNTSILFRTINVFAVRRREYSNSKWRSLNLELFVISKTPLYFGDV